MGERSRASIGDILRGGLWIYVSSLVDSLQGYAYWVLMSSFVNPASLGIASAIAGLSSLITSLFSLGIDIGVRRFFGIALGSNDSEALARYFWTSFMFTVLLYGTVSAVVALMGLGGFGIGGITGLMLVLAAFMIIGHLGGVPLALVTSLLKTEVLFVSVILSAIVRYATGLLLVLAFGLGWVGVIAGNLVQMYTRLAVLISYSVRSIGVGPKYSIRVLRDVIAAGTPSWLSGLVASIGSWLGVLSVYVVSGALETGYYYIAMMLSNAILAISGSIMSAAFPVISGMTDGRKRLTSRILKLGLAFSAPASAYLATYPWFVLSLLGEEYVSASDTLRVLALSIFPTVVASGISMLAYAYGNYRQVLLVGLSVSVVRSVLYYSLVPVYGSLGSAVAYTIGSLAGLTSSIYVAKRIGLSLEWLLAAEVVGLPTLLGGLCVLTGAHWFAALLLLSTSYVAYLRLKIITKGELKELIEVVRLIGPVTRVYGKYKDILDRLFFS